MKKILLVSFVFISAAGFSQPYTNSWIDYNKTYFKFNIGKNGPFPHTPQSALNSIWPWAIYLPSNFNYGERGRR